MHNKKLYGTATVGTKGQVVIPSEAREELKINPGDKLYVIGSPEGGILGLIKEDQIEVFIEKITKHIETFKSIKEETDKK